MITNTVMVIIRTVQLRSKQSQTNLSKKSLKNKTKGRKMKALLLILLLISSPVMAADFAVTGKITQINANKSFKNGGCMAYMAEFIGQGSCKDNWMSMQCDEGFNTYSRPENAKLLYVSAVTAMNQSYFVDVIVRQARKLDGYCVMQSITMKK